MNLPAVHNVLVVEDDRKIAQLVLDYLHAEGLQAQTVANGKEALDSIQRTCPSLVILDLMLPGLSGIEVCQAVRRFSDVPIIMLTARVDEVDRLVGLEIGADDYVCKPFSPRELMARVKAQLRRASGQLATTAQAWQIDEDKLRISWYGSWLTLTVLEFRMLRMMLRQPGRVFSRAQLLDNMHPDERDVSDRAIDSHIKNLRKKVQAVDPSFDCITSIYGVGYCFDPPNPGAR